ncbi:MAG: hypothetical protein WEA24_13240 [Gemmatimonadota bacterium]
MSRLGIYYEHPDWFEPLFQELERRDVPHARIDARSHGFDPTGEVEWDVAFNRMSPSSWLRGAGHAISYTGEFLAHLERRGVRVINGTRAWRTEVSKAAQIALLERLGLPHPRTRVCNNPAALADKAEGLRYPVIVKPNVGGSGAGVRRFDDPVALAAWASRGGPDAGVDGTLLVQEYVPPEAGRIVRVEVLNGRFLYAIRIYAPADSFNLCPADVCQGVDGAELSRSACAVDAPRNGLRVEAYVPPRGIIAEVERITAAAGIEIGGVEYVVHERAGGHVFYDVNALSNFVADGPRVLGFDPFARLADWLEAELDGAARAPRASGLEVA